MKTDKLLKEIYFNPKHIGSFGGPHRLSAATGVSLKDAVTFLQHYETYTTNKSVKHKFFRRKMTSHEVDYCWQADLIDISKYSRLNKGTKYLLTVIDTLSRFAFVKPLRKKDGKSVTESFKELILNSNRKPKFIQTDEGKEFFNKQFYNLLKEQDIKLFHNHSPLKAAMVERFNRTLMTRLQKVFTYRKTNVYYDILQEVVDSYNESKHRIIECSPRSVNKYNQMDVWFRSNKDVLMMKHQKPKLKSGDFVRIKINKALFRKGYSPTFTDEIYKISETHNSKPMTYSIMDNSGEKVLGIFYPQELSKVLT